MFIVIEMQTNNGETTVVTPIKTKTDQNEALSEYYSTLASAAISNIETHTVMLITETGAVVRCETFAHATEVEE